MVKRRKATTIIKLNSGQLKFFRYSGTQMAFGLINSRGKDLLRGTIKFNYTGSAHELFSGSVDRTARNNPEEILREVAPAIEKYAKTVLKKPLTWPNKRKKNFGFKIFDKTKTTTKRR